MGSEEVRGKLLTMMVGLPRSGKSTVAKQLSDERGFPIVSPDAIRLALHGQAFASNAEPFVWAIAKTMVRSLFLAGHDDVILDATNATRKRRDEWRSREWARGFLILDVDSDECILRAAADGRHDLIPVIERMAIGYEGVAEDEFGDKEPS